MRKLVTFRVIDEIKPHDNADKLELALIGGWQCIVKKDDFKAGELVIFFEIDSLLPIKPEFEFLRQYSYIQKEWLKSESNPEGERFRLKTVRLRQEISQGLIIPIPQDDEVLQNMIKQEVSDIEYDIFDLDLSEHFGVIKYDPPEKILSARMGGRPRGDFPAWIRKTDQERIQNIDFKQFHESIKTGEVFEVTQKYDGSSLTCFYLLPDSQYADEKYNGLGICSRNVYLKHQADENNHDVGNNAFVQTVFNTKLNEAIEKTAKTLGYDIAVQGELIGEGIQENLHGIQGYQLHVFDIFNITKQKYLLPDERKEVFKLLKYNGFTDYHVDNHTYLCGVFSLRSLWGNIMQEQSDESDELHPQHISEMREIILAYTEYTLPSGNPNEGLVFKSHSRDFSFKAVSNSYLLLKG